MNILFVTHLYPYPKQSFNTRVIHDQAVLLTKMGHRVTVICPVPFALPLLGLFKRKWGVYAKVPKSSQIGKVRVYYPRYLALPKRILFFYSDWIMYLGIRGTALKLIKREKFDIIHAHMLLPDGGAALRLAKGGLPLVITPQGSDFDYTLAMGKKYKEKISEIIKSASCVIAPVPHMAKKIKPFTPQELVTIGYGINIDSIKKIEVPQSLSGKRYILSASTLIKTKGVDLNIKAFSLVAKKYGDVDFYVVGAGPELPNLRSLVANLGIAERVKFLGAKSHKETLQYMKGSLFFSLPSYRETFGLVYYEAMAAGKPVIGFVQNGIDGVIKKGREGYLVRNQDPVELAALFELLLETPTKLKEMGKDAGQLAQDYDQDSLAKKLIDVYQGILS